MIDKNKAEDIEIINKSKDNYYEDLIQEKMLNAYQQTNFNLFCKLYLMVENSSVNTKLKSEIKNFYIQFVTDEIIKLYDSEEYSNVYEMLMLIHQLPANIDKKSIYSKLKEHINIVKQNENKNKKKSNEIKTDKVKTDNGNNSKVKETKQVLDETDNIEINGQKTEEIKSDDLTIQIEQKDESKDENKNMKEEKDKNLGKKNEKSDKPILKQVKSEKKKLLTNDEINSETRRLCKFGNFETIYKFLIENKNIPNENIDKLINTLCLRSDADGLYIAARDIKGVSIERIAKAMIRKKDIGLIYFFARDIKGAPIDLLANRLYELDKNVLEILKSNYSIDEKIDARIEKALLNIAAKEESHEPKV